MAWIPLHIPVFARAALGAQSALHRVNNANAGDSTASTGSAIAAAPGRGATLACFGLLALGLANLLGGLALGAGNAPSTRIMLEAIHANFAPFGYAMILCASAALAQMRRGLFAMAGALCVVALAGLTAAGLLCVCYQALRGAVIEPTHYLHGIYFNLAWPALHLAALSACAQAITRRPWMAAAATAALFAGTNLAFSHPLLAFGAPVSPWSNMNGYGPHFAPHLVAGIFWTAALIALLLAIECSLGKRLSRHSLPGIWVATVICLLAGAWTIRNTAPNKPATPHPPAPGPHPTYTRLDLEVDIDARQHRIRSRGAAVLANHHNAAIPTLRFAFDEHVTVHRLRLTGERTETSPPHHHSYRLNRPLAPKETLKITFDLERADHPFDPRQKILANGASAALVDLIPPLDAATNAPVALRVRIATSLEQIAIAPGRRTGEWAENGRRFFAYQAEAPIPLRAHIYSGRYATARTVRQDVAIHIHHYPGHTGRLPSLVRLAENQLSRARGDGRHPPRILHMVETPDYRPIARPPSLLALGWRDATSAMDVPPPPSGVWAYSEHLP